MSASLQLVAGGQAASHHAAEVHKAAAEAGSALPDVRVVVIQRRAHRQRHALLPDCHVRRIAVAAVHQDKRRCHRADELVEVRPYIHRPAARLVVVGVVCRARLPLRANHAEYQLLERSNVRNDDGVRGQRQRLAVVALHVLHARCHLAQHFLAECVFVRIAQLRAGLLALVRVGEECLAVRALGIECLCLHLHLGCALQRRAQHFREEALLRAVIGRHEVLRPLRQVDDVAIFNQLLRNGELAFPCVVQDRLVEALTKIIGGVSAVFRRRLKVVHGYQRAVALCPVCRGALLEDLRGNGLLFQCLCALDEERSDGCLHVAVQCIDLAAALRNDNTCHTFSPLLLEPHTNLVARCLAVVAGHFRHAGGRCRRQLRVACAGRGVFLADGDSGRSHIQLRLILCVRAYADNRHHRAVHGGRHTRHEDVFRHSRSACNCKLSACQHHTGAQNGGNASANGLHLPRVVASVVILVRQNCHGLLLSLSNPVVVHLLDLCIGGMRKQGPVHLHFPRRHCHRPCAALGRRLQVLLGRSCRLCCLCGGCRCLLPDCVLVRQLVGVKEAQTVVLNQLREALARLHLQNIVDALYLRIELCNLCQLTLNLRLEHRRVCAVLRLRIRLFLLRLLLFRQRCSRSLLQGLHGQLSCLEIPLNPLLPIACEIFFELLHAGNHFAGVWAFNPCAFQKRLHPFICCRPFLGNRRIYRVVKLLLAAAGSILPALLWRHSVRLFRLCFFLRLRLLIVTSLRGFRSLCRFGDLLLVCACVLTLLLCLRLLRRAGRARLAFRFLRHFKPECLINFSLTKTHLDFSPFLG
nr:MAG TPA: hypothetical protein [Caudoviricetes sp.]